MLSERHLQSLWEKFISVTALVDISLDIKTTRQSTVCRMFRAALRGVYSDTTQLTQLSSVQPSQSCFLFMTSRPTNWVNCCSRCRVQLSWVELCRYKRALCHIHTRNIFLLDSLRRSISANAIPRRLHNPLWSYRWFNPSCSVHQPASLCSLTVTLDSRSLSSVSRRKASDELDRHAARPSRIPKSNSCQVSLKQNITKMWQCNTVHNRNVGCR